MLTSSLVIIASRVIQRSDHAFLAVIICRIHIISILIKAWFANDRGKDMISPKRVYLRNCCFDCAWQPVSYVVSGDVGGAFVVLVILWCLQSLFALHWKCWSVVCLNPAPSSRVPFLFFSVSVSFATFTVLIMVLSQKMICFVHLVVSLESPLPAQKKLHQTVTLYPFNFRHRFSSFRRRQKKKRDRDMVKSSKAWTPAWEARDSFVSFIEQGCLLVNFSAFVLLWRCGGSLDVQQLKYLILLHNETVNPDAAGCWELWMPLVKERKEDYKMRFVS